MSRRRPEKDRFVKERERSGFNMSSVRTRPLAPWLSDPSLLPKHPPNRTKRPNSESEGSKPQ